MADTLRVLYVDDEPGLLGIGKRFLEKEGAFTVNTLTSAKEALDLLNTEHYDAIISDYQMPEMDGIQFLVEVRARFGQVPFILFTGRGREEVVIQAINCGADFYLQKGGEPGAQFAELVHKIKQAASRKRADDALKRSEEKYHNIIEDQTEFISRFLPDGTHIFVNDAYCRYFGVERENILGRRFRPVLYADDRKVVAGFFATLTPGNPVGTIAHRIIMPDGNVRWQRWSDRAIFDDKGNVVEYQSVGRDITEQKEAEVALERSKTQLTAIIQGSPIPKFVIDKDHHVIHWNKALEGYSGILEKEIIGTKQHWRAFYKEERPCMADLLLDDAVGKIPLWYAGKYARSKLIEGAYEATDFFPHMGKAGTWLFFTASVIKDDGGNILGAIETLEDITETYRKTEELKAAYHKMEEVLDQAKLNEEKYRHVVEDQTELICRFLPDGTHVFVNEAYCRYFGISRENLIGSRFRPRIPAADRENVARLIASLTPEHPLGTIDQQIIMPDGSTRWQRWVDRAIFHADGSPKEYQSVGRDITESQQVETRLRESEERLNLAIHSANLGLWDMNLKSGEVIHNQRWAEMLGFSMDELEKPSVWWAQRVHPDDYQNVIKMNELHCEGKTLFFNAIYRMKHKNGEWRWVHSQGKVISRDSGGAPLRMMGINQDITERKLAEEALLKNTEDLHASNEELTASQAKLRTNLEELTRQEQALCESEERLNFAIESAYLGLWDLQIITHELVHNQQWTEMLGFSGAEMEKPSSWWQERVHPDDLASVTKSNKDHLSGKTPGFDCIYRMKHKNGEWRWIHTQGKAVSWDSTGVPLRMIGINQDITERKLAEETRRQLTEFQDSVITNVRVWLSVLDQGGKILMWNTAAEEISGYRSEEVVGKNEIWKWLYPEKEYRKQITDTITRIIHDRKYLENFETTIRSKEGKEKVISWNTKGIPGANGRISDYIAIGVDVTDRQQAEVALRESEDRLNLAIESAHLGLWDLDLVTNEVVHNSLWAGMLGFSADEIGKPSDWWEQRIHPEDYPSIQKKSEDHFVGKIPFFDVLYRMKHKDGDWRWVHSQGRVVSRDGGGRPLRMIGINQDITGKKQADEALRQANRKLNLLYGITRHDITNQLTMLRGYLAILEEIQPDPSFNEYVRMATNAAQRISAMVQFTKEYEQIGICAPAWQDCRSLVDTVATQAQLGPIAVKNDLPAGIEVFADPLIINVCYNLVDNAVRYGGKITNIRFFMEERDGERVIVCEDDGEGVPAKDKEKIFGMGFGKNTGLGLALSREILDITGITIHETGEPGNGARFEITVPKGTWRLTGAGKSGKL